MSNKKVEMPQLAHDKRVTSFDEVALGYNINMAKCEADRCLGCQKAPCVANCPVAVRIPEFIAQVADGNIEKAYEIIKESNSLPAVCGRVCPQESQCEKNCVRGIKGESIAIGRLERFVADNAKGTRSEIKCNGIKIAIVGSGPAGLSCAGELAKLNYKVTVFEALHTAGGVLIYGIPEFRLPKKIVQDEIDKLKELGVEVKLNMVIGKIFTVQELYEEGYKAVFVGSGAGFPVFLGIEGENLNGVYYANEFLTRINLMKSYKFPEYDTPMSNCENVAVIGGGNVAIDAARSAVRLGAKKVSIVYRRMEKDMPARLEEVEHAKEEGVSFVFQTAPKKVHGNKEGQTIALECIKMILDSEIGRPVPVLNSEYMMEVDTVIVAIGQSPNNLVSGNMPELEMNSRGGIISDEQGRTNIKGVYAGGDAVSGAATVILAMGAGKLAARAIDEDLKNGSINQNG